MKNGTQTGPATTEEISALLASGELGGEALVWCEGQVGWSPVRSEGEFAGALGSLPPIAGVGLPAAADVEKNKFFGILAYLPPLLFLVPWFAARASRFAMYHCNQGLVLTLAAVALGAINAGLRLLLVSLPVLGWFLLLLHLGTFAGIVVLVVIGLRNAAKGVCQPLPFIGGRLVLVK